MSIDEALHAALGYMLPEGANVEQLVVGLFERVQREANKADSQLVRWQGETKLAKGWGWLVIQVDRVGAWEEWRIARRDVNGDLYDIMRWEAMEIDDADEDGDDGD